jgi:divalent metal cation (Fe/Co/Zn/Cd) transporter
MTLLGRNRTKPSYLGVATLIAAAVIMPLLAREKRRLSALSGSAALRGDSAQSALCGYLSLIALGGVALNAFLHVGWADPMAALAITPLVLREGREVLRGKACGCC